MSVQVGQHLVTMHFDDHILVCEPDARMSRPLGQGYFAADTRFVSGYRLKLGGLAPSLLNSSAVLAFSSRFEFTNPALPSATGGEVPAGTVHLRLDRTLTHGVHEDYQLANYHRAPIEVVLEASLECDFADIFDVRVARLLRRGSLQTTWDATRQVLTTDYRHGGFRRALSVQVERSGVRAEFANGGLSFFIELEPGAAWHACLLWIPDLDDGHRNTPPRPCGELLGGDAEHDRARREWVEQATRFTTSPPEVERIVRTSIEDLSSLRMHRHDVHAAGAAQAQVHQWVPAAGVPWFVSLFGRDALIVSLQTLALAPRFAVGTLRALAALQADRYDDARDMQPGKIQHELRQGELATLHLIPHTPYYGTADATTLYVLAAAEAWRWHGDRAVLDSVRPNVERALAWIDTDGDTDGDGLQEYATRAGAAGYYNQGWKDSGDAIVTAGGEIASLPIALCELQGYVVAAKRAWAGVVEEAYGERAQAARLRDEAARLAKAIEERFWWEEEGTYYLGLDGRKQPIRSVASNAGHLLWSGAVAPERARRVARRLLADDLWSGWGIRTLSSRHAAYNPFSYQRGSVWPHDNAIIVAGLRRYGLEDEASTVAHGVFDAAEHFRGQHLPELFAGLERGAGAFPVQYLGANVPQAWAAGAVVQILTALLGLEADATGGALVVRPSLPVWLDSVTAQNLEIGNASVDLEVRRRPDGTHDMKVTRRRGEIRVGLVDGKVPDGR
ncbi:MAG: amylo-alpha-1,6-glucosidase [Myxococcaceae bacterium]